MPQANFQDSHTKVRLLDTKVTSALSYGPGIPMYMWTKIVSTSHDVVMNNAWQIIRFTQEHLCWIGSSCMMIEESLLQIVNFIGETLGVMAPVIKDKKGSNILEVYACLQEKFQCATWWILNKERWRAFWCKILANYHGRLVSLNYSYLSNYVGLLNAINKLLSFGYHFEELHLEVFPLMPRSSTISVKALSSAWLRIIMWLMYFSWG